MMGAARREKREWERFANAAKWTGAFAQVDPRKQPSVKKMLGEKPVQRRMSGKEIGSALRAWARRVG